MKTLVYISLIFLGFISCDEKKPEALERYTVAWTYANNNICEIDTLEITNTVCNTIIHFDNLGNVFAYCKEDCNAIFYKGNIFKLKFDSLKNALQNVMSSNENGLNRNFIKEGSNYCGNNLNIIVENDTLTKYYLYPKRFNNIDELFFKLFRTDLKRCDSTERILQYKYYITTKEALRSQKIYNSPPVNKKYFPIETLKFTPPVIE